MSDKLYEAFRIYLTEGLLGVEENQVIQFLDSKGYEGKRREEAIDAYMKVTKDPILKALIPELPSYDLNHEGTDIRTLYSAKKNELDLNQKPETKQDNLVENTDQGFVEDIKKIQDKIAETQKIMVQEPDKKVDDEMQKSIVMNQNKALKKELTPNQVKLSQIGYANVVLMSIIVIIIVAIICVFIFSN